MVDSISEANIQDLIDTVSAFVDELPETQETMNTSLTSLETFLDTDNKIQEEKNDREQEREILYPFARENQHLWRKEKLTIDRTLSRSYPVVKDLINSAMTIGQQEQTLDKSLLEKMEQIRQPSLTTINLSPPKPTESLTNRFRNFVNQPKKVEDVVENPWMTTHDTVLEAKQAPNVWKKLAKAHATGCLRAYYFNTPMLHWRSIELWYLTSNVEPEIMKMIEASDQIVRTNDLRTIATILSKYYEQKEQEQKSMAFGG